MTFSKEQKIIVILLVLAVLGSISVVSYVKEQNHQRERHVLIDQSIESSSFPQATENTTFNENSTNSDSQVKIAIHIEGAVQNPGLYYLDDDSRYDDAVKKAGGLLQGADRSRINLARKVYDEAFIYIPMVGEEWEPPGELYSEKTQENENNTSTPVLININTANQQELMSLSGIGEVYAQRIIDYRNTNGAFQSIEDIMKVSGIGNVTFENIKSQITK